SATTSARLGTCTFPAGLLETGDRVEIRFTYSHTGTASGFTGDVRVGGTSVTLRAGVSAEPLLVGSVDFTVGTTTQVWNSQSWGSSTSFAAAAGASAEDTTQNLTVDFRGFLALATMDSVTLSNFTVIRYPAQSNP